MKCHRYTLHGFQLSGVRITLCSERKEAECLDNLDKMKESIGHSFGTDWRTHFGTICPEVCKYKPMCTKCEELLGLNLRNSNESLILFP